MRTKWLESLKYCGVFGAHGAPTVIFLCTKRQPETQLIKNIERTRLWTPVKPN
ncbi:hypothetical protein [Alysiella crassa]|uniref:hypothetical protein n=1 Tax=Alysiella crassa TaxID=153491 RepID=UPI001FCF7CDF|nr:hypothetical protein [Alysiella crassa]UOP07463.1 hypothetical protein LVJ80_03345 [Alysiella crassa]